MKRVLMLSATLAMSAAAPSFCAAEANRYSAHWMFVKTRWQYSAELKDKQSHP